MTEAIYLSQNPTACKNTVRRIGTKIKDASSQVQKATSKLNDANKSDLSYEINQLQSMYRESDQYASEFDTFADKVENMVNAYIETDNTCAKRIRSNGKTHRKQMGLPKNIMVATIGATFEKIDDKVSDLIDWVDDLLVTFSPIWNFGKYVIGSIKEFLSNMPIVGYIQKHWDEISGIAGNLFQIGLGVAAMCSGAGFVPGLISVIIGFDQLIGNAIYSGEKTVIKDFLVPDFIPDWIVDVVYDGVDIVSGFFMLKPSSSFYALDKLNKIDNVMDRVKFMNKLNKIDKVVDTVKSSQKMLEVMDKIKYYTDIIMDGGDNIFSKGVKSAYKGGYKKVLAG